MEVSVVPIDEVLAIEASAGESRNYLNIFDTFGTQGCLLDCQIWQTVVRLRLRRTTTTGSKREKQRDLIEFIKSSIKNQHEISQSDVKLGDLPRKVTRTPFTLRDLMRSSKNGCGCCQFFMAVLKGAALSRSDLDLEELVFEWLEYKFFLKVKDRRKNTSMTFQLFCPTGVTTVIHTMYSANVLAGDTSSATSLKRAEKWINDCATSHKHCGLGRDVPLPRRLVDLEPLNDDGVKLAITDGMTGTYACLSHCWGKLTMPVKTTKETLNDYLKSIPWAWLPKTFQDAVTISRRLGVRYLWIDSLCIIQDSDEDWQQESGRMASIYQNGFVTIAAVSASDFRGGCFSPDKTGDICLRIQGDGGMDILVVLRDCKGEGMMVEPAQFDKHFPLFTRAWVYQERMMSRRVLSCSYSELQFECREQRACECDNRRLFPHMRPAENRKAQQTKQQYSELMRKYGVGSSQYSLDQLCQHWLKTVAQYTRFDLTYGDDKLPALSGCAQDIGRWTGDEYLAGIWRASLAEGMLWNAVEPIDCPRPEWRAPSWSWASVDTTSGIAYTKVESTRYRQVFRGRIEAAECATGANSTGRVNSGFIRIRSRLCPVYMRRTCRYCSQTPGTHTRLVRYLVDHSQWYSTRSPGVEVCKFKVPTLELESGSMRFFPDFKYDKTRDFDFFGAEKPAPHCSLAPILLLHLYDGQGVNSSRVTEYFLALKKATASQADSFERIALVTITFADWDRRESWFKDVFSTRAAEEKPITIL